MLLKLKFLSKCSNCIFSFSIALRSFHLVERLISDLEAFELGQEPEEMKTLKVNNLVSMAKAYEKSEKYAASLKAYGRLDHLVLALT